MNNTSDASGASGRGESACRAPSSGLGGLVRGSWGRKFKKSWHELGFYERATIIRDKRELRESKEYRTINRTIIEALRAESHAREQREAKRAKLRAYLLANRTQLPSPNP